jgi:AraC-like DNA-binding protein
MTHELQLASGSTQGFLALRDELADQGVATSALLDGTQIAADWFEEPTEALSHGKRLSLIRNAWRLSRRPDTALRAGQRQRVSDFGMFGYALASSPTVGDAIRFGLRHLELAGPVMRISYALEGGVAVFRTHHPQALGPLMPFVAEFWRSSITTLMSLIIERPFPNLAMYFPYPAPSYVDEFTKVLHCPVHFDSERMEWHFDAAVLDQVCPNASSLTAKICSSFCERVMTLSGGNTPLQQEIRIILLGYAGRYPSAPEMARDLGLSERTFFRRLGEELTSYQAIVDDVRHMLAVEYLQSTHLTVEEIAHRVGFTDTANFRKAFFKWAGKSPSQTRRDAGIEK